MLIENGAINTVELRQIVPTMNWLKLPRKLGINHTDYFYCGLVETDEKQIKITIKPSLWMTITETLKNRKPNDGSAPEEGYKGNLVDWGYYLEVKIDNSFLDKIKELSQEPQARITPTISW